MELSWFQALLQLQIFCEIQSSSSLFSAGLWISFNVEVRSKSGGDAPLTVLHRSLDSAWWVRVWSHCLTKNMQTLIQKSPKRKQI